MTVIKTDPSFSELSWVTSVISKEKDRQRYSGLHVASGIAYATDGRRIHRSPITDIPDGDYTVTKPAASIITLEPRPKPLPNIVKFFDIDPTQYNKHLISFPATKKPGDQSRQYSIALSRLFRALSPILLDITFIEYLIGHRYTVYILKSKAENTPIVFKSTYRGLVIMPFRP